MEFRIFFFSWRYRHSHNGLLLCISTLYMASWDFSVFVSIALSYNATRSLHFWFFLSVSVSKGRTSGYVWGIWVCEGCGWVWGGCGGCGCGMGVRVCRSPIGLGYRSPMGSTFYESTPCRFHPTDPLPLDTYLIHLLSVVHSLSIL